MNAPSHWSDEVRFTESSAAFRGFFTELKEAFVERESLFTQLELALLCKEHVLIIGPPGTAKSAIAGAVLGRIVDEKSGRPSLFSKQLAENTVQTDLIGPVDFKVLTETGRTEHLTEEGMLGAVHAFLDEVFDGRDMLLRSILNVLHERELKHGRKVTPGRCECAVMTSNRYLSEVLQRSPETLQAFADRISFICFAPKSFARRSSRGQMLHRAQTGQRPALHARMTLQQLDVLQEAVEAVEVPPLVAEGMEELADALERELLAQVTKLADYVPTKYFSQRSMVKALWVLKAIVVRDRMYRRPERRLVAEISDLEMLRHFFILGGPVESELEALLKLSSDPRERAQLEIIRVEHKTFAQAFGKLAPSLQQSMEREAADLKSVEDLGVVEGQVRSWSPSVASTTARALRDKLVPGPRHPDNRKPLLRAAEVLLQAMEHRCARGMAGQGEGRGGVAVLGSFGDVLELAQRVPELHARLPHLARSVADFSHQAAQMIALAAEGSEFDEAVRLDGVTGLAANLAEELERLGELVKAAGAVIPEMVEPSRAHLLEVRERTAQALRRRATRTFTQGQSGRKGEPLELLIGDSRRLRELERCLVELSASHQGLRVELLAPLAEQYARDVVNVQPFNRLDQFLRLLQGVIDNLEREGASPASAVRVARDDVERRVRQHAASLAPPKLVAPDGAKVVSGEAYSFYRQQLTAHAIEGELAALKGLDALLRGVGAVGVAPEIREQLADAEVQSLGGRVRYLSSWWALIEGAIPLEKLKSAADYDKAFDALVKSRFPMLVTREGEFVRVNSALGKLNQETGPRAEVIRSLTDDAQACEQAFTRFSRRLIDGRAKK